MGVVREQDGVVGHHGVAGGQDATGHVAHHVQNTVVHQEVIDQQLHAHKHTDQRWAPECSTVLPPSLFVMFILNVRSIHFSAIFF